MTQLISPESRTYHKKRLKNFWERRWNIPRPIEWWIGASDLKPLKAGYEVDSLIKDFIRKITLEKKITMEEAVTIWDMYKSSDKESRYMAMMILKNKTSKKFEVPDFMRKKYEPAE